MKSLGIVTARAGSKRLPKKNIMPFKKMHYGLPWQSLGVLLSSNVTTVVLTTDIIELQDAAKKTFQNRVRVVERPPELATDEASHVDVVKHVLNACPGYDCFVLTQPTSPFVEVKDINFCLELIDDGTPAVFSVNPAIKPNGAIYAVRTQSFLERESLFVKDSAVYVMDWEHSVDIDEQCDFVAAEAIVYGRVMRRCCGGKFHD